MLNKRKVVIIVAKTLLTANGSATSKEITHNVNEQKTIPRGVSIHETANYLGHAKANGHTNLFKNESGVWRLNKMEED